jgi:hypothetical protein
MGNEEYGFDNEIFPTGAEYRSSPTASPLEGTNISGSLVLAYR